MSVTITGVDPGLVHTGVVTLSLWPGRPGEFSVKAWPVGAVPQPSGAIDTEATAEAVRMMLLTYGYDHTTTFIEKYEPRSHFDTDSRMSELVREIHRRIGGKVISNTGSKQTIKPKLMDLLHLSHFQTTHHQDLQAAARILVWGALKDDRLNEILFEFVEDHLDGKPWRFI